ncbi:MAG: YHS domain-containing protein [Planctomycetes bacterium]|nr:YHS domain-containing protein [Planctomycetota bacterium]
MQTSTSTAKDPICGMAVDTATAIHLEREGKTFYFCGDACRTKFNAAPSGKPPECTSTGCCE